MLPVDQVIPFIRHEDPWVVDLALHGLEWVRRPHRLTGDFVLDAVRDGHPTLYRWIYEFQISPAVLDDAIDALAKTSAGRGDFWALRIIAEAPDHLLTPEMIEKIRGVKPDRSWIGTRIRTKLEAFSLSTEQLRNRFVELCEKADREMSAMSEQHDISALADSLGDRCDVDWAMEKLSQSLGANNWMETWLFVILTRAAHRPAFDVALGRFTETNADENDALVSELSSAISQLCEPADLDRIASLWERCASESRSYLIEEIGHLRFAEAEPFLLRITQAAEEPFVKTLGAIGLCEMLCRLDEARQLIAQMIDSEDYDPVLVDLKDLAVPLGTIIGLPFPKQDQWRKHVAAEHARMAAQQRMFNGSFLDWPDSDEAAIEPKPARAWAEPSRPLGPVDVEKLTSAKTVGRNDPCPCGSGKKYKKCCLLKG